MVFSFKMGSDWRPLLHWDQCVTFEISKGMNTHETSNTVMKQTAVFHYTKRKNREEGAGRGELGKHTDWTEAYRSLPSLLARYVYSEACRFVDISSRQTDKTL